MIGDLWKAITVCTLMYELIVYNNEQTILQNFMFDEKKRACDSIG